MAINAILGEGTSIGPPGDPSTDSLCPSTNKSCPVGAFVRNDTLFSWKPPNRSHGLDIRLIRTNASVVLEKELPHGEVIHPFHPVVGGRKFAISIDQGKGGSEFFDMAPHFVLKEISVYDSLTGQQVYTLDGNAQRIKSISAFALSADGSLLGLIDQDGILRVYRMPGRLD